METLPATAPLRVSSEIEPLRQALVHRPGRELERLTPRNREALLFEDLPWPARAREEHDAFCAVLAVAGVETLDVQALLGRALDVPAARTELLDATVAGLGLGRGLEGPLREWLGALPGDELAAWCIGGITFADLPFASSSLAAQAARPADFVLAPLPNSYFTRDPSTWVGRGVVVSAMATPVRRREAIHHSLIYRHHPRFAGPGGAQRPMYVEAEAGSGAVEGGDICVLGDRVVLVGCGDRTHAGTIESLAAELFAAGVLDEVLAVILPRRRPSLHLDTVFAQVDRDAFMVYADLVSGLPAYALHPGRRRVDGMPAVKVTGVSDLFGAVARALGVGRLRLFDTGDDAISSEREQWSGGSNVLALAPGRVVAWERNVRSNARLREGGVQVIEAAGGELGRGRGGPRCMALPLRRDPSPPAPHDEDASG